MRFPPASGAGQPSRDRTDTPPGWLPWEPRDQRERQDRDTKPLTQGRTGSERSEREARGGVQRREWESKELRQEGGLFIQRSQGSRCQSGPQPAGGRRARPRQAVHQLPWEPRRKRLAPGSPGQAGEQGREAGGNGRRQAQGSPARPALPCEYVL